MSLEKRPAKLILAGTCGVKMETAVGAAAIEMAGAVGAAAMTVPLLSVLQEQLLVPSEV